MLFESPACNTLTHINASNTAISDATIASILDRCSSLRSLIVSFCSEIANPFESVLSSRRLAIIQLDMSVTCVSNFTIHTVCHLCPRLNQLNVSGPIDPNMLTDEVVTSLQSVSCLSQLGLAHCSSIHFPSLATMFRNGNLNMLVFLDLSAHINVDCSLIIRSCPVLQALVLDECRNVICCSDGSRSALMPHKCLHHLSLKSAFFSTNVDVRGTRQLSTLLYAVPNVRRLYLDCMVDVCDDVVVEMVASGKSLLYLEVLSLSGCGGVSNVSLDGIGDALCFLEFLDVSHCVELSRLDMNEFREKMKTQGRAVEVKWR